MGREYTPLPHEYLEEMDCLSDAEYGRLIRALQNYSITKEEQKLSGQEKVYWKRVRNREDRYQESFGEQEKAKAERAKNAANARWTKKENANAYTGNATDAYACSSTTSNAKNANTNTNTNTDTDTKANTLPTTVGESKTDKPSIVEFGNSTAHEKPREAIPYAEIVAYLNEKAGTEYRASTTKTRTCIHARWEEGFRLDDFKAVISKKCVAWKGTDMAKYLRPETLFGAKFEGYLNEPNAPYDKTHGRSLDADEIAAIRRMVGEG